MSSYGRLVGLFLLLLGSGLAQAEMPEPPRSAITWSFKTYLAAVGQSNLTLAAQRFNVDIAEALISVADLFPDPVVTLGLASYELTRQQYPNSTFTGLSWTLEMGDKRGARKNAAEADRNKAQADLQAYFYILRNDAANAFLDSLRAHEMLAAKKTILETFSGLGKIHAAKLKRGTLTPLEAMQYRVELQRLRGEIIELTAAAKVADQHLASFLGATPFPDDSTLIPSGRLDIPVRAFHREKLLASAMVKRSDVIAAQHAIESATEHIKLAKANRSLDLGLSVGITHTNKGQDINNGDGTFSPGTPPTNALMATVSVPIPFSAMQQGELRATLAAEQQAEIQLQDIKVHVDIELRQALTRYESATRQLDIYNRGIKKDVDEIWEKMVKGYKTDDYGFLEIFNAERTLNETNQTYIDITAAHAKALLAVTYAAGEDNVDF